MTKLFLFLFIIPFSVALSQGSASREKALMQKGVDAFSSPMIQKNQKVQGDSNNKFFNFEMERISPTFDGSMFLFNHLNPNMSPSPKYVTDIFTDVIITIVPVWDEETQSWVDTVVYEEKERSVVSRAKNEWKVTFGPAFFFDIDYGDFILNQSEGSQMSSGRALSGLGGNEKNAAKLVVTLLPETSVGGPYFVRKFTKITAGMGGTVTANVANAGILSQAGASIALIPTIGGGKMSESLVGTLEEAKKIRHLDIPDEAKDFESWRINDLLEYEVHGGISIAGGVGFYGLSAGVTYTASGFWKRTYKRLDERRIQAQLDRNKLMSFGAYAGAVVASMSIDKFIQWENGLSYIFDLSNEDGRMLLKDFMKGNIKNIQAALEGRSRKGVTFASQKIGKSSGWSGAFGVGVPFVPASARWSKSNMFSESQTTYLDSTRERNETRVAKVTTFRGRFFPLFKTVNEGFFSQVANTTGSIDFIWGNVKSGQYAYTYQRRSASRKDLLQVIDHLRKKTALFNFLNINIPENISHIGSVDMKFAFKLKTPATQFLIAQKDNRIFETVAFRFIDSYFDYASKNKVLPKDDLCSTLKKLRGCSDAYKKDTQKAIGEMKAALNKMAAAQSYVVNDRENFAKAYAEFGDAMTSNPFLFQTVVNITKAKGGDVYLSIESEKLKKYEAIMRWKQLK